MGLPRCYIRRFTIYQEAQIMPRTTHQSTRSDRNSHREREFREIDLRLGSPNSAKIFILATQTEVSAMFDERSLGGTGGVSVRTLRMFRIRGTKTLSARYPIHVENADVSE